MNTMHWVYWVTLLLVAFSVASIVGGVLWFFIRRRQRERIRQRIVRYTHHCACQICTQAREAILCREDDCTLCNTPSPQGHRRHDDLPPFEYEYRG